MPKTIGVDEVGRRRTRLSLKFVHLFFTFLLISIGTGIFIATMSMKWYLLEFEAFLAYYMDKPVIIFILGSILLIACGWLGVIVVARIMYYGIVTYGILLLGLFLIMITMGGLALATADIADNALRTELQNQLENYEFYNASLDSLQNKLSCCGVNNYTDWTTTQEYIPESCCNFKSPCSISDFNIQSSTGCYEALKNLVDYIIWIAIITLSVLFIIQIISMILTLYLGRAIRFNKPENEEGPPKIDSDVQIPRIHNPFGTRKAFQGLSTSEENSLHRDPYVRHPVQNEIVLNYTNPHEQYLTAPVQLRFDRREGCGINLSSFEGLSTTKINTQLTQQSELQYIPKNCFVQPRIRDNEVPNSSRNTTGKNPTSVS